MCQEIRDKLEKLHKEGGMPLKIEKTVEKILIKNMKLQKEFNKKFQLSKSNQLDNIDNIDKNLNNKIDQLNDNTDNISSIYKNDIIAIGTQWSRIIFNDINQKYIEFLNSKLYNKFSTSIQSAHLISILIFGLVVYSIWPELFGYGTKQKNIFVTVIYLLAVATHFGALIWMTFFSGLALYFSLPRHTFGQCQHVLFPMYFALNSVLSILTFTCFIKIKSGHWNRAAITQALILALCAITEIIVRLYLAPLLVSLMKVKYNFEKMSGSGKEIGYLDQRDLTKCPHYQGVNKRFRTIHMGAALGNIAALTFSIIHILYLAQKVSIS